MICKSCKKEFTDSMYLCPYCGTANPTDTLQNVEPFAGLFQEAIWSNGKRWNSRTYTDLMGFDC